MTTNTLGDGFLQGFAKRLRLRMADRNVSGLKLEELTGISHANISCYVNAKTEPRAYYVALLCEALGVSADWLLGLRGNHGKYPD